MALLRALAKLPRVVAHMARGWWTILRKFPRLSPPERARAVEAWAQRMLDVLDITLVVQGQAPQQGPLLLVCNHLSWLDILVIHAARHVRFVSKAAVRHWPVVGTLASGAGTLFIERESRRDALRVVHGMASALAAGELLAVFPEGTTSAGSQLLAFHGNLLQAAIATRSPVQPSALGYFDGASGAVSSAPDYVGDDWLVASLWRTLAAPRLVAKLSFGEVQSPLGKCRRPWAAELRGQVAELGRSASGRTPPDAS